MTESLTRKNYFGQVIDMGFEADVHSVSGAPKEAFVKIEQRRGRRYRRSEALAPGHARAPPRGRSRALLAYLAGDYVTQTKGS